MNMEMQKSIDGANRGVCGVEGCAKSLICSDLTLDVFGLSYLITLIAMWLTHYF